MPSIERPATDFRELCALLAYRKRTVRVVSTLSVTLYGLNWEGGSKSVYSVVDIINWRAFTPELGIPHPLDNENEGAKIAMRPGIVICQHGWFCGKASQMTINVHPENMPALLEESHAYA